MTKYRKKPIVVEAVQWKGNNFEEVRAFVRGFDSRPTLSYPNNTGPLTLYVAANDAWLELQYYEWIIRDRIGFYPCQDSVFKDTYEEVEE